MGRIFIEVFFNFRALLSDRFNLGQKGASHVFLFPSLKISKVISQNNYFEEERRDEIRDIAYRFGEQELKNNPPKDLVSVFELKIN